MNSLASASAEAYNAGMHGESVNGNLGVRGELPVPLLPGGRTATARTHAEAQDREQARERLLGADRGAAVLDAIRASAEGPKPQRWAAQLFASIVGWTGTVARMQELLERQFGASPDEARRAVEMLDAVPRDVHTIADECRKFLSWYESPNGPGFRRAA